MADINETAINSTIENATEAFVSIWELNSTQILAKFEKAGNEVENGLLLAYAALLLMALFPIWNGSKASVVSDEEKAKAKAAGEVEEVMTSKDAMMFPIFASCALFGLYTVFKLFGKEYINLLLGGYFFLLGVIATTTALRPIGNLLLPESWKEEPYHIVLKREAPKKNDNVNTDDKTDNNKQDDKESENKQETSSKDQTWVAWLQEQIIGPEEPPRGPEDEVIIDAKFNNIDLSCLAVAAVIGAWYLFTKHWIANNFFGLSFSYNGIAMFTLGSFRTGCILLSGLFLYDIFWVFGTDVMVTVARSFEAPIKVLFPKDFLENGIYAKEFAMLGLGDIVLPGVVIALLLRFDVKSGFKSTPYFIASFIAYIVGLVTTIVIMHTFQAAQPALLYLVPAVLLTPILLSIVRGETRALYEYDEEDTSDADEEKKTN